ncbi:hypothetical protein BEH_07225 [Priestia filamentosa]|uniref:Uncharacterized protein n=1 Tax=Priestia filamentosa TaxID=1402861 RepID=A0A2S1LZC1_9BACI|nr:hypothetical protein [Priestia filamentosa]AWG44155.1 hypothetical protein BEH_07225 [Priestia filamentosa]
MQLADLFSDVYNKLADDEQLFRYLYYPTYEPLSEELPNVHSDDDFGEILDDRLVLAPQTNDLSNKAICRICLYLGVATPNNEAIMDQSIVLDVYSHIKEFEKTDIRSLRIITKLSKLLIGERVAGIGKVEIVSIANIANSPTGYVGYRMICKVGRWKK